MRKSIATEAVEKIRAAYMAGDEEDARLRALKLVSDTTQNLDSEAVWNLAELLVALGEEDAGVRLSERQALYVKTDTSFVRHSEVLTSAGRIDEAVDWLRTSAKSRGASADLVGGLLMLATNGAGWGVLEGLTIIDPSARAMAHVALRRAADVSTKDLDMRRVAYILGAITVLGASEDEGDEVAPYWFMNLDETEVAWMLRRSTALIRSEKLAPTCVRAGDSNSLPLAHALATELNVSHSPGPVQSARCIRIFGTCKDIADVEPPHPNDVLTVCCGVTEYPNYRWLIERSPIDVVGIFAPTQMMWSTGEQDDDDEREVPAADLSGDRGVHGEAPTPETIAVAIGTEVRALPRDRALPSILRFYKKHCERAKQLEP